MPLRDGSKKMNADCRVLNNNNKDCVGLENEYLQVCMHSVIVVASIKYPRQTPHVKLDWNRLSGNDDDDDEVILRFKVGSIIRYKDMTLSLREGKHYLVT